MPIPERTAIALRLADHSDLPGTLASERLCEGAKFHSPSPLLLQKIEIGDGAVWLCGTCSDNLQVLRHLLRQHDGNLPWAIRREFGNLIRAIALREWVTTHPAEENEDDRA